MKTRSDNAQGALLMMASMASFTFNDACIKAIGEAMPLPQILVLRGSLASAFIALLAWRLGSLRASLPAGDRRLVLMRAAAEVGGTFFFLTALRHMPLANVTALLQMLPLTLALGSAVFFAEPVGWRRWVAIGLGFVGMLLIVRPGTEGFSLYSVYALVAVACVTMRDLVTRRMSAVTPSLMVTLVSSLAVVLFGAVTSVGESWVPLTPTLAALIAGSAVFVISGYTLSVLVMRKGDVSFIAPFRYTGLIWALLLGALVFGDWPVPLTLCGAALIVATGSYTLWRESQLRRRAMAQAKMRRT
ncbi:MAG: EamA/RhaT family transporter [Rhodobacteraceae bacterium]|jgi:drug/metabolite transporter (DMT)-like permease|uniref:S-adenosylmethionine uptake transporter n=1 Tax=Salipiger profundus TaxID=1229727 RepID=A0A1U7D5G0_9RHOB|nr:MULTISPECIES: DMT family transporter [Salipiger]APX23310.1 S-adenosylmethionine uptake transporter [Salipiger profundus]MAB04927.1 EamA/RhaT family transporter [Paracoccaceae bacterium]GGA29674.1 membrane protein [Salipiger profundus]SFD47287.1 S-adenosylmethionine uptake transporter [Salipiger profundus]